MMAFDAFSPNNQYIVHGSVRTINHSPPRQFDSGMAPQDERLLVALMGGGVTLIACLALVFVCYRKYKLTGMRQSGWRHHRQMRAMQYQQHCYYPHLLPMHYPGFYYPSQFYQTAAPGVTLVDPRLLAPGMACAVNSAAATSSTTGGTTNATTSLASQWSGAFANRLQAIGRASSSLQQQIARQQRKQEQQLPLIGSSRIA